MSWSPDDDDGDGLDDADLAVLRAVAHAPPVAPSRGAGARLGRYRVDGELGRGGMGVVLAAHDEVLDREVALKVVPLRALGDAREQRRLIREARAAAAVAHPGIATVYDVAEIDGQVVLAMERIRGRTLRAVLADAARDHGGPAGLRLEEVARIGAAIARALDRAHDAGLVHRDLKPENVMVAEDGAIKVLDFGVARRTADAPERGAELESAEGSIDGSRFAGTPGYAAPEQRSGAAVDGRADQWALGVLVRELATGAREGMPPPALGAVVRRCTAGDPADRWERCGELAVALDAIAATAVAARARRGRPRVAVAVALTGALAALGLVMMDRGAQANAPLELEDRPTVARDAGPIACPPLAVDGIDAPSGWLGAAGASLACRRLRAHVGGARKTVLVPAALLDVSPIPTDAMPVDPYGAADARDAAIAAARRRGHAWLDGRVEVADGRMIVTIEAHAASGAPLGEPARAEASTLQAAVRRAVDELVTSGALQGASAVDPEIARWTGARSIEHLLDRDVADAVACTAAGAADLAELLENRPSSFGDGLDLLAAHLAGMRGEAHPAAPPRGLDATDAAGLARTALAHLHATPSAAPADLAALLATAREDEGSTGRAALLHEQAQVLARSEDPTAARPAALAAAAAAPEDAPWPALVAASFGQPGIGPVARAYAAWRPESADAYNILAHADALPDGDARLAMVRRAHLLSDGFPLYAGNTGSWLLRTGRREEARALAARLALGDAGQRVAAARLMVDVLTSEGRIGAALAAVQETLATTPRVGSIETGDVALLFQALELGRVLGREREVARRIVERFVLADPPRLAPGAFAANQAATACAALDAGEARRCFDRLRALRRDGHFRQGSSPDTEAYVEGAERWAEGDVRGAARAFRRLRAAGLGQHALVAGALDAAGEHQLAEHLDPSGSARPLFGGVSTAHVRAALRAMHTGDRPRARALAHEIVEAWTTADEPLPAVTAMRALLRDAR